MWLLSARCPSAFPSTVSAGASVYVVVVCQVSLSRSFHSQYRCFRLCGCCLSGAPQHFLSQPVQVFLFMWLLSVRCPSLFPSTVSTGVYVVVICQVPLSRSFHSQCRCLCGCRLSGAPHSFLPQSVQVFMWLSSVRCPQPFFPQSVQVFPFLWLSSIRCPSHVPSTDSAGVSVYVVCGSLLLYLKMFLLWTNPCFFRSLNEYRYLSADVSMVFLVTG